MRMLLFLAFFAAGCSRQVVYEPVDAAIPIPVPCRAPEVEVPRWPFQSLTPDASIFEKTKMALVEMELRKSYEEQLEAAAAACR